MKIPVISFFTGAGFLDMGFEATDFDVVWTNEINPMFADMYEFAVNAWQKSLGINDSLAIISSRKSITELFARDVLNEAFPGGSPELFGVIGGPPCPDFSIRGKNKGANGAHGRLSRIFIDMVCEIKPTFFVMENVPGLYKTKRHRWFLNRLISQVERAGYVVDLNILNALEFGAPQDRQRLFLIGFSRKFFKSKTGKGIGRFRDGWFCWPSARYAEAKTLPWPKTDPFGLTPMKPDRIPIELTVFPLLYSEPHPTELPNGKEFFNAYSGKFWQIAEGDVSHSSFKRLHRYRYSPTACYGNNEVHLHPSEPRRLSVREALRIQAAPDEYVLPPEYPLSSKFKMISNGVPYIMANELAKSLVSFLDSLETPEDCICKILERSGRIKGEWSITSKQLAISMK